jgi:hypothetical protein
MTELAERPFFIVGNPRSGTTLLRFILSSHPRIYVPGETGFVPFLLKDFSGELSLDDLRRLLERIGRLNRAWSGMVADIPAWYAALPEPRLAYVLDALYRHKAAEYGAVHWGDKTPSYVLHIAALNEIFPTAQFVHLIRDGRDATLSAEKKWGRRRWYMDNYYLLRNWVRCVERGRAAGRKLGPSRYLEVCYENLVRDPEPEIRRICDFLEEDLHADMLDHTRFAHRQIGPGGHVEVREPISTASVRRWEIQMSPFDKKIADRVAGNTLSSLGYQLANLGPLSSTETGRLFFLASKYRVIDLGRRTLTAWGMLTLNRGKRT